MQLLIISQQAHSSGSYPYGPELPEDSQQRCQVLARPLKTAANRTYGYSCRTFTKKLFRKPVGGQFYAKEVKASQWNASQFS